MPLLARQKPRTQPDSHQSDQTVCPIACQNEYLSMLGKKFIWATQVLKKQTAYLPGNQKCINRTKRQKTAQHVR
jgi:hypothetical protein